MSFPVVRVCRRGANQFEPLGSKPKFWFDHGRRLFKEDIKGVGTDWAEAVASRLCDLIGLPHVHYDLAVPDGDGNDEQRGVVCENMASVETQLVHGNELLLECDRSYPSRQRWKVQRHTVEAVCAAIQDIGPPVARWTRESPADVSTAIGYFSGYALLDAWIANQDRHHENWGVMVDEMGGYTLAPTFDHGAGLACILTDEEREKRLSTRDRNFSLRAFCGKARSGFFALGSRGKTLHPLEVFHSFAVRSPAESAAWKARLTAVTAADVSRIIGDVPDHLMSQTCKEFTCQLLMNNRAELLASA